MYRFSLCPEFRLWASARPGNFKWLSWQMRKMRWGTQGAGYRRREWYGLARERLNQKGTWTSVVVGNSSAGSKELSVDILSVAGTLAALEGSEALSSL